MMSQLLLMQVSSPEGSLLSPEIEIVLMIVFAVVIVAFTISGILSRYRRIPPDKALILYGGGEFRALTGAP